MSQKIKIILKNDGTIATAFEGFVGDNCYAEAEKLKRHLAALGVELDIQSVIPHDESPAIPQQPLTEKERS